MIDQQKIISLLQTRNKEAIEFLYDNYSNVLYGVILKIVQSETSAEDILQDVFVKIWKNGHKYNAEKSSLFTWMLNISRNTAIDHTRSVHFKKNSKNQVIDIDVYNKSGLSDSYNIDQIGLRKMVDGLDDKYQEILELVYFKGYTQKEVQEHLGIPLGTVKTRVRIALRELRTLFS